MLTLTVSSHKVWDQGWIRDEDRALFLLESASDDANAQLFHGSYEDQPAILH